MKNNYSYYNLINYYYNLINNKCYIDKSYSQNRDSQSSNNIDFDNAPSDFEIDFDSGDVIDNYEINFDSDDPFGDSEINFDEE